METFEDIIKLPEGRKLEFKYYLKKEGKNNGTYIRIGSTNRKATKEIIQELERHKRNISFDSTSVYELDADDLMLDEFKEFYYKQSEKKVDDEALYSLRLLNKERGGTYPSAAAVLLSDPKIKDRIFPYAKVDCARFKGMTTDTIIDQATISEPIFKQPDLIINFIKRNIAKSSTIEGIYRKDRWEYPLGALREAVVNAVIHRDYSLDGMDIKVAIFDNMLTIISPGNISPVINMENIENNPSEIRNKVLAPIFKDLKMIEQWGTGFKKIKSELKKYPELELKYQEPGMVFQLQFSKKEPAHKGQYVSYKVNNTSYRLYL
jgi:predicted HTH transcriptional regulator